MWALKRKLRDIEKQSVPLKALAEPGCDELRRALARSRRRGAPRKPASIVYQRDLPRSTAVHAHLTGRPAWQVTLGEAVKGEEVVHCRRGAAYIVTRRIADIEGAGHISSAFREKLNAGAFARLQDTALRGVAAGLAPSDMIFMDVESTGLGSSPLFLIGTMVWRDEGLVTRQFFARNYAEEAAVIGLFLDEYRAKKVLVTFNGKSFDLPFIRCRAAVHGLHIDTIPAHCDLLHVCRRIWKDVLPDCRLQTLETFICRRTRYGDIAGSEIPEAYHAFVRSENAWQIAEILKHNVLDLITMADIMTRFPSP